MRVIAVEAFLVSSSISRQGRNETCAIARVGRSSPATMPKIYGAFIDPPFLKVVAPPEISNNSMALPIFNNLDPFVLAPWAFKSAPIVI